MSQSYFEIRNEYLRRGWSRTPDDLEVSIPAWCQEAIAAKFSGRINRDAASGDFSFTLYPFPKIPLYYIFHLPDEEFPAEATCLFGANALEFMPLDGLADVAEYTAKRVVELLGKSHSHE